MISRQGAAGRARQGGFVLLPVVLALTVLASIAWLINRESVIHTGITLDLTRAITAENVARAGYAHTHWGANNNGCMGNQTMANVPFGPNGIHSYSGSVSGLPGTATAHSVIPDRDSWIREALPDDNFGGSVLQSVLNVAGDRAHALYHFDVSGLPANEAVVMAKAWFYVDQHDAEGAVTLHRVLADWDETALTWNSLDGEFDAEVLSFISPQSTSPGWVAVNITGLVQVWVNNPADNHGILLQASSENVESKYATRSSVVSERPWLEITTADNAVSPAIISATGTLATDALGNAVTRDIAGKSVRVYQTRDELLLQPGPEGRDAYISSLSGSDLTTNFGDSDKLLVSTTGGHALLNFGVSGKIPGSSKILSATLEMHYLEAASFPGKVDMSIYPLSRHWEETEVTWNLRAAGSSWSTPGGDYLASAAATTGVLDAENTWISWNVTSLVQSWLDRPSTETGMLLSVDNGSVVAASFASSDHANPRLRPRLRITYACECGSPCMTPREDRRILLVKNTPLMNETEVARKSLFESWGYSVNTIAANESQANFNAAFNLNDSVYVPGSVSANTLDTKLTLAQLGVVIEQGLIDSNMELSNNAAIRVGDSMNVLDNSHMLTEFFPAGPMKIYSARMEQQVVTGGEAPDLQVLATVDAESSFAVLEQNDRLANNTKVLGRRVLLPIGRGTGFKMDHLDSRGRLLVQRSLKWVMSFVGTSPGVYLDEFNNYFCDTAIDYSGSDGTLDWSPLPWTEIGEGDNSCAGQVSIESDLGSYRARIAREDMGLQRQVDLTGFTVAWLHFDYRRVNFNSANDQFKVEVSDNGGADWNTVATYPGPGTDAGYISASVNISMLATHETIIRFKAVNTNANGSEPFYIDNVLINANPSSEPPVPPTSETVLLVVGDDTSLDSRDAGRKALLESWGYTVILIDDGESQGDFDDALTVADLVYVTASPSEVALGSKLDATTVPLLGELAGTLDNFGFSDSTVTTALADGLSETADKHYIGIPFDGEPVTLFNTALSMPVLGGTLAPDGANVGLATAAPGVVTLDAGAELWNGGTSPARRAHLPYAAAETGDLTTQAELILQRTLEWLSGTGADGLGVGVCAASFRDYFDAESYSNSDGSLNWLNDWTEIGEATNPGGGDVRITDDIDEFQLILKKNNKGITRSMDMTGYTRAKLDFDRRFEELKNADDYLLIEATVNGTDWFEVGRVEGPVDETEYSFSSFDLGAYMSDQTAIRLITSPVGDRAIYNLDNIEVCIY